MKKTSGLSLVIALEIIALEIGAYTYAALLYHDRRHVLLLTGLLCLVAGIIGTVVTRAKAQATSCAILLLGFLGGLAGIIIPRSMAAALGGLLVLGLVTLSIGLYCLTILGYHGRAYMVLGTGTLCLLGSLVGIIVNQYRAHTAGR